MFPRFRPRSVLARDDCLIRGRPGPAATRGAAPCRLRVLAASLAPGWVSCRRICWVMSLLACPADRCGACTLSSCIRPADQGSHGTLTDARTIARPMWRGARHLALISVSAMRRSARRQCADPAGLPGRRPAVAGQSRWPAQRIRTGPGPNDDGVVEPSAGPYPHGRDGVGWRPALIPPQLKGEAMEPTATGHDAIGHDESSVRYWRVSQLRCPGRPRAAVREVDSARSGHAKGLRPI